MQYIEAVWEKENLNKKTLEIKIKDNELLDNEFINNIQQYDYIIVKIMGFSQNLSQELSKQGFYYAETMCHIEGQEDRFKNNLQMFQYLNINYKIDNSEEKCKIVMSKVNFKTDRISLDINFGIQIAHQRYLNWMRNFIKYQGAKLAIICECEQEIGFTFYLEKENSFEFILSGIFDEYAGKGYGSAIIYIYKKIIENTNKKAITSISTNNLGSLHTHIKAGYVITGCESVFVKHNK